MYRRRSQISVQSSRRSRQKDSDHENRKLQSSPCATHCEVEGGNTRAGERIIDIDVVIARNNRIEQRCTNLVVCKYHHPYSITGLSVNIGTRERTGDRVRPVRSNSSADYGALVQRGERPRMK